MSNDTGKNHLRYADLLQGDDRRIRACCFRWAKNGGEVLQGVADADSIERQNFDDSEKMCIFAIRKPIIMKRHDIPELIPQGSGGTHASASSCILEQSGCNV